MARSVMQHSFSQVPEVSKPRSTFDRSMRHLTTFDAGYLVPVYNDMIYPGDTVNFDFRAFCRLATPLHPFMDNMYLDWMAFFVPHRLVWDNFQRFMGERDDPDDSIDFLVPVSTFPVGGYAVGSLQDYLGLPTEIAGGVHITLPVRSYNLIYNQHIRDQNLQDSVPVNKGDGPDTVTDYVLRRRGKRHDYFTSSLPWPQKGEEVSIPIGTSAPVLGLGKVSQVYDTTQPQLVYETGGTGTVNYASSVVMDASSTNAQVRIEQDPNNAGFPGVFADLTSAADVTISALRTSIAIQQFLEIDARSGTRYIESNKAHFGVTSPDARLQRAEYLMGGSFPINVSPVAQTSETGSETPQGNLAAIGTVSVRKTGFTKSFTEHGTLLVLVSARADLSYQQGLDRRWSLRAREEWYYPSFAHLSEQAVLNKEIMYQGTSADDEVFGYQERFAELRYNRSYVTGQFRSTFATSLDTWHLSQDFSALPTLNSAFIQDDPPVDRVIAVTSEPHFLGDFDFRIKHARVMPMFGVPGLLRL